MLNTVKNVMHRFDGAGDFAKDLGGSSVEVAKTVGVTSLGLAKKVGVKRGLAGFAILGVAVGGIVLARYLKRRASETPLYTEEEIEQQIGAEPQPQRRRRQSRAKRKANHVQH